MINDTGVVLKSLVPALAALHLGGRLRDCLQAAIHLSTEVRVFLQLNDKKDIFSEFTDKITIYMQPRLIAISKAITFTVDRVNQSCFPWCFNFAAQQPN